MTTDSPGTPSGSPAPPGGSAAGSRSAGHRAARAGRAGRPQVLLTGRGALLAMSGVFFLGLLGAGWLGWGWLAGGTFLAGSTAAARYTRRSDLLWVTASPPLLFGCALVLARVLTSGGSSAAAVAGGCLLLLAGVAPWLFAGVAASLVIAWLRGLPRCISEFRAGLRLPDAADGPGAGPGGGSRAAGASGRGQEMR